MRIIITLLSGYYFLLCGNTDHDDGDDSVEDLSSNWSVGLDMQQRQKTEEVEIRNPIKYILYKCDVNTSLPPWNVPLSRCSKTKSPTD